MRVSLLCVAWLLGCTSLALTPDAGATGDDAAPRSDAGLDAGSDAGGDVGPDGGADAAIHVPHQTRCASTPSTAALASSLGAACRLDEAGQLWCWGANDWGQVVAGGATWVEPRARAYDGLSDVVSLSSGPTHTCVVHHDGGVSCWGLGTAQQLGDGTFRARSAPTRLPGIDDADEVVAGDGATCARRRSGAWTCWGGQAALRVGFPTPAALPLPVDVPALAGARRVALGAPIAAAVWDDGHVESARGGASWRVAGIDDATDVVASYFQACALRRSGSVTCWGDASVGADVPHDVLDDAYRLVPTSLASVVCAIRRSGTLTCWGPDPTAPPTELAGAADVDLAVVNAHTCIATCDGSVRCDGPGVLGENGDGESAVEPSERAPIDDAIDVDGSCVLRVDGTTWCRDATGYLEPPAGVGCVVGDPTVPAPVLGLDHAVALSGACVLRDDGDVACLRAGAIHVLRGLPAPASSIATLGDVVLALTTDGRVLFWLATGDATTAPTPLAFAGTVDALATGAVVAHDGTVHDLTCASFFDTSCTIAAAAWPGIADADAVWTGARASCARRTSGAVECRLEATGRVVLAESLGIAVPDAGTLVPVPVLDGAREIDVDAWGLCARDAAGAVRCFGDADHGRLGVRDASATASTPIASGASAIGLGDEACAVRGGRVVCWGLRIGSWGDATTCPPPFAAPIVF